MLIAGLLTAIEALLPFVADLVPRGVFATLSLFVISAAFVTRLLAQKGVCRE